MVVALSSLSFKYMGGRLGRLLPSELPKRILSNPVVRYKGASDYLQVLKKQTRSVKRRRVEVLRQRPYFL